MMKRAMLLLVLLSWRRRRRGMGRRMGIGHPSVRRR